MSRDLPSSCRWILIGDFNMVERRCDKSSSGGSTLSSHERLLFDGVKQALQVEEAPLTQPSLIYSWDNARADAARIMARLDRCYIFPDSPAAPRRVLDYCIRGDHSRSDHCPLFLRIELARPVKRPSRWIMASQHFDSAAESIREAWLSGPSAVYVLRQNAPCH